MCRRCLISDFLALLLFISQVVCIALPALLMALMLTGRPLKTLLLDRMPSAAACGVAVLLAVLLHPVGLQLVALDSRLVSRAGRKCKHELESFAQLLKTAPYPWLPYVLMAVLPAICEELAFRGFMLSGLRHLGSKWWAIGLSAVFFGMAHGVIQQSLSAAALGMVIGYVAVQTGSLVPCMLFHVTYNGIMFSDAIVAGAWRSSGPTLGSLIHETAPGQILYNWPVVALCSAGGARAACVAAPIAVSGDAGRADQRCAGPAAASSAGGRCARRICSRPVPGRRTLLACPVAGRGWTPGRDGRAIYYGDFSSSPRCVSGRSAAD